MFKKSNHIKSISFLCMLCFFSMYGCASIQTSATLSSNIPFEDKPEKFPQKIGLYISPESKTFVCEQFVRKDAGMSKQGLMFTVDIGSSLEQNALRSLKTIFQKVIPVDSTKNNKFYTVNIELDKKTNILIGKFVFSKRKVNIHLMCRVFDINENIVFEELIETEAVKSTAKGWLAAGLFGQYARKAAMSALQVAGEESLHIALETCNQYLVDNRDNIFE